MIFNILLVLISILLENIFNIYLNNFIYLTPLFTLISLIFIFFYFKNDRKGYLYFSFFTGLLYDFSFTNFYILNCILFTIISYIVFYILKNHNINIFTILYSSVFSILFYNLLLFLIFNFFNYINYSIMDLSIILRSFFISNIIYTIIIYIIIKNSKLRYILKN